MRNEVTEEGLLAGGSVSESKNCMTSSGSVAAPGVTFTSAQVRSVRPQGGRLPTIAICHGRHPGGAVIAVQDAIEGAVIDLTDSPEFCPNGIYLDVGGAPASIEVLVTFR